MSAAVETTRAPVLEIRDLSTRFGDREVHRNLSLEVRHGEIFALVGGSGSGKSTLLREVILLKRPSSGSIRLFGIETTELTDDEMLPLRRRYGMVFQQGALFSTLTVLQNVAVPLREHTPLSNQLIEEIAAIKIGLTGLPPGSADLRPDELSGGMLKRAALARALALDPELLLLDEPTAGLDPASSGKLGDLLRELRNLLGLTMLLVTHDTRLLWRAADRVAFLTEGRIAAAGRMDELARSDVPELREFFGASRLRSAGS